MMYQHRAHHASGKRFYATDCRVGIAGALATLDRGVFKGQVCPTGSDGGVEFGRLAVYPAFVSATGFFLERKGKPNNSRIMEGPQGAMGLLK